MGRFRKSAPSHKEYFDGKHRYEHWYRDNTVYLITARVRDRYPAFESEAAKEIFWDRFTHYTHEYGFTPIATSLMNNHYRRIHEARGEPGRDDAEDPRVRREAGQRYFAREDQAVLAGFTASRLFRRVHSGCVAVIARVLVYLPAEREAWDMHRLAGLSAHAHQCGVEPGDKTRH
jgi:hypothetical protein